MRFCKNILIIIFLVTLNGFSQDKRISYIYDPTSQTDDQNIKCSHLDANLHIFPARGFLQSKAVFTFRTLRSTTDSLQFSAHDLDIDSVLIEENKCIFKKIDNQVIIYPAEKLQFDKEYKVKFFYSAYPPQGLHFIGWDDTSGRKRKQIWAHRPDRWLPFYNSRLTVDMHVTVDKSFQVFSNGIRIAVTENTDATKTWHYKMEKEHPYFSTCLVIGNYDYIEEKAESGVQIELWYYPDWQDKVSTTYIYMKDMFKFLESEIAPYPYELYRQAPLIDYPYGGMETTTATVFGDFLFVDENSFDGRNYINVNVHELSHQWFGNCISHMRHHDVVVTEGFATFYAKIFERWEFGEDHFQFMRDEEMEKVLALARQNSFPIAHTRAGNARFYQKGSLVLDMLETVMGKNEFRQAMQYYFNKHAFSTVVIDDFLRALRESSGMDLTWFFEQWIYRGGEPHYQVAWQQYNKKISIDIAQIQPTDDVMGLFKMPVQIHLYNNDRSIDTVKTWINEQKHHLSLPHEKKIDFIIFDPNRTILKNLTFPRSYAELQAQAERATSMIDRFDAIKELDKTSLEQKRKLLHKRFYQENFHMIKCEIIRQLADDAKSYALFKDALQDSNAFVRRKALQSIDRIPQNLQKSIEQVLEDKSYINIELALEKLCDNFPANSEKYLQLANKKIGWRGKNIRIKWLEIAISNGDSSKIAELVDYTSPAFEFETRIRALQACQSLNYLDEQVCTNLINATKHWHRRLRNESREIKEYFSKQKKYAKMLQN